MAVQVPLALVRELRAKIRDYAEWNYLYEDEESSNQQLARILHESLEHLNLIQPILDSWTFQSIPRIAVRFIIDLAVSLVLQEVSIWMVRNQFQYQAGNTSVRLYDKWQAYRTIAAEVKGDIEGKAGQYKISVNINGAWGENITELYDSRWIQDSNSYISVQV